ncbi:MAG: hypothetical protein QM820_29275 [Minicystis sp.]
MTTRPKAWLLLPILSCAGLGLSAEAFAETGPAAPTATSAPPADAFRATPTDPTATPRAKSVTGPDAWPAAVRAIFVGVSGGLGYARFKQPEVASTKFVGPMLSFQAGYRLSERWAISVVYTDFTRGVSRPSGGELFSAGTSLLRSQAECAKCVLPISGNGGAVLETTFRLSTLNAAVDVTPFGKNGPFLGVAGGLGMATVTETIFGASGTARGGFRYRPVDNVSLGIEGGIQGQTFRGGSAALGYGAAEIRLGF